MGSAPPGARPRRPSLLRRSDRIPREGVGGGGTHTNPIPDPLLGLAAASQHSDGCRSAALKHTNVFIGSWNQGIRALWTHWSTRNGIRWLRDSGTETPFSGIAVAMPDGVGSAPGSAPGAPEPLGHPDHRPGALPWPRGSFTPLKLVPTQPLPLANASTLPQTQKMYACQWGVFSACHTAQSVYAFPTRQDRQFNQHRMCRM